MNNIDILIGSSLELTNVQKSLDNLKKQKHVLNIDIDVAGIDKLQESLKKLQKSFDDTIAKRQKLETAASNETITTKQEETLKRLETKEQKMAAEREQLLRNYAALEEQFTQARIEALARIESLEQQQANQRDERINRQAAAFQKMYGTFQEGVTLPVSGGTEDMEKAIHAMEGFSNANVKATGSMQVGQVTLDRYIATVQNAAGGFDTYKLSVDNVTGELYLLDQGLKSTDAALIRSSESANQFIDAFASALVSAGILRGLEELKNILWECVEASVEFESALAGVKKTTNFDATELSELRNELLNLSTTIPTTVTNLAKIAEIAGQLGVEKDKIADFTHVMADLGASTNLAGEEAATMFSRFANITQMPQTDFDRLGSSIVQLGNNMATTESEIGAMSLRLASAGQVAGMSEASIVGLSAALSSVGIKAEMGGSAFSKAMNMINIAVSTGNENLEDFARVAGMSAEEFTKAWGTNAAYAMVSFTEGLADVERHGKNTVVLLDELGLTEVRLSDALRRAAGSGDLFRNAIEMSNAAWDENIALTREAGIRYSTTESQMQLFTNSTNQLQIAVGDALNPAIKSAVGGMADFTLGMAEFVEDNELLVQSLTVLTVLLGTAAGGIAAYAVGIKALSAAKLALAAATGTVTKANAGFMATLVATPLGPVIIALAAVAAGITAVTIAIGENNQKAEEARRLAIDNGNALKDEMKGLEDQKQKVIELHKALADGNITQEEAANKRTELMSIQDELIQKYGSEAQAIDLLGGSVDGLTEKYDNLIESAAKTYLTDNASAINNAREYVDKLHNPNEDFGFSQGTKVFFTSEAEAQMDQEVQDFIKSLNDSLGGKFGFAEKWDWDQWIFGGYSTELRFDNATVEDYINYLRQYSDALKEFELETGKDLSKIRGELADQINEWNNDDYKQHLEVLNKATEAEAVSTYRNQYRAVLDAQREFNRAYAEGDVDRSDIALRNLMEARDNALAAVGDDTALQDYFNKMVEGQEQAFKRLSWKDVISQNEELVKSFDGLSADTKITDWTQEQKDAFDKLRETLGITSDEDIPSLINALIELGYIEAPIKNVTDSLTTLSEALGGIEARNDFLASINKEIAETGQISVDTIDKLQKAGYDLNEVLSVQNGQIVVNTDAIREQNEEMTNSIIQSYEDAIAKDENTIKINENTIAIKENEIARLESIGAEDTQSRLIAAEIEALEAENVALQENIDKNRENIDIVNAVNEAQQNVISTLSVVTGELSNLSSSYDMLIAAQKEITETGSLTASTLKSLTDNNLLQYLEQSEQGIWFNVAALEADFEALKADAIATATAAANKEILAIAETYAGTEARNATPAIDNIGDSAKTAGEKAAEGAGGLVEFAAAAASITNTENLAAFEAEYNRIAERLKGTIAGINSVVIGGGSGGSGSRGGSGGGKSLSSQYQEELRLVEEQLKNHVITIEEYYQKLEQLRQKYVTDPIQSERVMLENQRKYEEALKSAYDRELKLVEERYKSRILTDQEYYQELERLRNKYITDTVESERIALENIRKFEDAMNKTLEERKKVLEYL